MWNARCSNQGRLSGSIVRKLLVAGAAVLPVALSLVAAPATSAVAATARPVLHQATHMVTFGPRPQIPLADRRVGPVGSDTTETAAIVLRPRSQSALKTFVSAITNKNSALYHQYLPRGTFRNRFGPLPGTIARVESALSAQGLHVTGASRDGLFITVRGSASQFDRAFGTTLEKYRLPTGAMGQATVGAPRLPSTIIASVLGIVGLDDLAAARPAYTIPRGSARSHGFPSARRGNVPSVAGAPAPCADAQQAATLSGGLSDDQIANAYGTFGLYSAGDFGAGQHIAVYELQPFLTSDISTFDTCYFGASEANQMAGRLTMTPVDGGELQPGPGSGNDEANLDIEDVSALAPQANIDVYEAPNTTFGALDEYTQIVNDDVDQVVTSSWGICEQLAQVAEPGLQQAENLLFEQAAAQGQTVLSAEGDTGSDSCNESRLVPTPPGQNLLSVLDPASQPYVVSVGGTTIDDATQPPSEHVWNDGADWGAGGGGISESWQMPSWQRPAALTAGNSADMSNAESLENSTASMSAPFTTPTFCDGTLGVSGPCRETPDVSAQSDEFTGSITIYGQSLGYGFPTGWATIGGTSSATPIWAAMLALVNASSSCSGDLVNGVPDAGFASPILYGIASNPVADASSFNDITSGNNDLYGLDNGLSYPARAGWDMASGLGSPQLTSPSGGNGLAYYMCQYGPTLSPPTVTLLGTTSGSTAGGETITVHGSGFGTSGAPLVQHVAVGSGSASDFAVVNNTTLSVTLPSAITTVPAGSPNPTEDGAGPAQIIVTATDGESSVPSVGSVFEYVDEHGASTVPSVTGLSPYGGLDSNPATVTVFGSGFAGQPAVDFGGIAGSNVTVLTPYELTVTPPRFSSLSPGTACPADNGGPGQPLNPAEDVCQVVVTVTENSQTSSTATPLPPWEGPLQFDSMGAEVIPSGCSCEDEPQTDEYDYVPTPTITSVSTSSGNSASLASEYGGATTNTVTVNGTGLDPLTMEFATLGSPTDENSIFFPEQESGTSMVLLAPALLPPSFPPTIEPVDIPVGAQSLAGASGAPGNIVYAGVPVITSVVNSQTGDPAVPDSQSCPNPPPGAGCGTPITITAYGGLLQAVGPIIFYDPITGTDLSTQYNYSVASDTTITTQSVQQNPDVVTPIVCTNTGCDGEYNVSLFVYPPGDPKITSVSPGTGPAQGGNQVVLSGANLGCAVKVMFGSVPALQVSNAQALLDCGQTGSVDVTVPPGQVGSVPVTIETVESEFTGSSSNSETYHYVPSAPSAPQSLTVAPLAGAARVRWTAPAVDGGDAISGYNVSATTPGRAAIHVTVSAGARAYRFPYLQPGVPWSFSAAAVSSLGQGFVASSSTPVTLEPGSNGFIVATANGGTFGYGSLSSDGGPGGGKLQSPITGISATADALGYVEVAANGKVYNFGNADNYGSATVPAGQTAVGIAETADAGGYWVLLSNGEVLPFGDAGTFTGPSRLSHAVAIAATADGLGYYVLEASGIVTAYGDATAGLQHGVTLQGVYVGIAVNPAGTGYWLLDRAGKVQAFGQATGYGSIRSTKGAAGIAAAPNGKGYWVVSVRDRVFKFGSAQIPGRLHPIAESNAIAILAG